MKDALSQQQSALSQSAEPLAQLAGAGCLDVDHMNRVVDRAFEHANFSPITKG